MPLQRQNATLSLGQGVDTKKDPFQVQGKLLRLENGVFTAPGRVTKRNGHDALSSTTTIPNAGYTVNFAAVPASGTIGNTLATYAKEMLYLDGFNLFSYDAGLIWRGNLTLATATVEQKSQASTSRIACDSLVVGGTEYVAFVDSINGLSASFFNTKANVILYDYVVNANGVQPRWALVGGTVALFYYNTSSGHIEYVSSFPGSGVSVATDPRVVNGVLAYDVCTLSNGNVVLAYNSTGNSNSLITFINYTSLASSVTYSHPDNADSALTIWGDSSNRTWYALSTGGNVRYAIVNSTFNGLTLGMTNIQTLSGVTQVTGVFDAVSSNSYIFYSLPGVTGHAPYSPDAATRVVAANAAGSFVGGISFPFCNSASLASKAWLTSFGAFSIPNVILAHDSALQGCYLLANLYNQNPTASSTANIAGRLSAGAGASITRPGSQLPQVSLAIGNAGARRVSIEQVEPGSAILGVSVAQFDFAPTNYGSAQLGNNLHFSGAQLNMYDGEKVVEHGFHVFPEYLGATAAGAAGSLSAGLYGFVAVYLWSDSKGQQHRSAPSLIFSINVAATNTVTVTLPTLRITNKVGVQIEVYRTVANGTILYYDGSVANNMGANSVTYASTASDAVLLGNRQLYTTGGEVDNIVAPASSAIAAFKSRLVLVSSETPNTWWFSKQELSNTPIEFSDFFTQNVPSTGGPITALGAMDSNLVLFKDSTYFYVQGEGPAPSGANNDFTPALEVMGDSGCVDPASVVRTPMGLIYRSAKGVMLLERNMAATYVGADVAAYLSGQLVRSAVMLRDTQQVRLGLGNSTILVYDYLVQQWSVFTVAGVNATSAVVEPLSGRYTFVDGASGVVWQENPASALDAGAGYRMRLTSAWLKLSDLQGYQRARHMLLLGNVSGGTPSLTVVVFEDFDSTAVRQTSVIPMVAGTNQWRVDFANQLCDVLQIDLTETNLANETFSLSGVTLELAVKKGTQKLPASRQIG